MNKKWIIHETKFLKTLENYLNKNTKKDSRELARVKQKIPPNFRVGQVAYRGMAFDDEMIEMIKSGKTKIKLDDVTSWTSMPDVAEKFLKEWFAGTGKSGGKGIIFKKNIPSSKVVVNVHALIVMLEFAHSLDGFDEIAKDSAMKEFEILVDSPLEISKKDIYKIIG